MPNCVCPCIFLCEVSFWTVVGYAAIVRRALHGRASGNVFVHSGFDPAEATVLQMRANLMSDLRLYIEKHKLTPI